MKICGWCNGIESAPVWCSQCGGRAENQGKVYDMYDDYSPYMDADLVKLADGIAGSSGEEACIHLFACVQCGTEEEWCISYQSYVK